MEPLAIHHVSVVVHDLDGALDFYTRVLGMRRRDDRPTTLGRGAWLDVGDQQVHLLEGNPPPPLGQHFAVRVADLDATRKLLLSRGAEVSDPVAVGTARQAFVRDPSGNTIELHEAAASPGRPRHGAGNASEATETPH